MNPPEIIMQLPGMSQDASNAYLCEFVAQRIDCPDIESGDDFGPCLCVGVAFGGRLIGGVVYYRWKKATGVLCAASAFDSPFWATRDAIHQLLAVAFDQIGANRLEIQQPRSPYHDRALRMAKRMGFISEGINKDAFGPGYCGVTLRMLRCEYLRRPWERR